MSHKGPLFGEVCYKGGHSQMQKGESTVSATGVKGEGQEWHGVQQKESAHIFVFVLWLKSNL